MRAADASTPLMQKEARPDWMKPLFGYTQRKTQSESLAKCQRVLQSFLDDCHQELAEFVQNVNETLYDHAFSYKGRLIAKAPILHIAIWLEASDLKFEGVVEKLIEAGADMEAEKAKASYFSGAFEVKLHAITVAAGMGSVQVLQALTTGFTLEQIKVLLAREDLSTSGGKHFYTPLHDACFLGKTASIIWLLDHGAPTDKSDLLGMTPLHLFTVSGNFDELGNVERTVKELVRCRAPLDKKVKLQGAFRARWGELSLTPLEMATQHDASFPKDCMRFLAPSLQLLLTDTSDGDPLVHEASPQAPYLSMIYRRSSTKIMQKTIGISFFNDLLMLCKKSPNAAEELANEFLVISEERGLAPLVRQKLMEDAQQPDAVDKLVRLMTASPNAASSILKAVIQSPRIQDPTHYPMRMRTSLWGPLVNTPMRCEYMPDASKARNGVLVPEWFYNAVGQWHPSWHDKFAPKVDDVRDAKSAYDVNVAVLPVPDILSLDFMQALASVNSNIYYRVFACKPVQGIVSCMWQTLVQHIYEVEMFLALVDVVVLLSWGLTLGNGAPFSRLWETPTAENNMDESPHAAPIHWAWLAGTCAREYIALLCWFLAYTGRWYKTGGATKTLEGFRGPFRCLRLRRWPSSETYLGTWRFDWLLLYSQILPEFLLAVSLNTFLVSVLESSAEASINPTAQAMLALNAFMRCMKLVVSLSVIRAFGPRIIAVLSSMISGAMREMLFISTMVFVAFQMVFLVLRREHTASWTAIYLYRGLLFGDGDGLDRFGIADKDKTFGSEVDTDQHNWSTFYGTLATLIFNIAILNLIIAIYSDEYKEQQKRAPMMFVQMRSKICASSMLKYHTLGWLVPLAAWVRWAVLFVMLIASSAWIYGQDQLANEYGLDRHIHLGINGAFVGILQITLLTAMAHTVTLPAESLLKDQPKPSKAALWAYLPRLGVHSSVPTATRCRKRRSPKGVLDVEHAKLINSHCLEVKITYRKHASTVESFEDLCREGQLHWSTETQRGKMRPVDVILPQKPQSTVADGTSIFESTLVFEPVMDIWRPLKISVGGLTETVRLPRFLWLCCRDDFDRVEGVADEVDTGMLHQEVRDLEEKVGDMVKDLKGELAAQMSALHSNPSGEAQDPAHATSIRDMQQKLESVVSQDFPKKLAELLNHTQKAAGSTAAAEAAAKDHAAALSALKKQVDELVAKPTPTPPAAAPSATTEHLKMLQGHADLLRELKTQVGELVAKPAPAAPPAPPPATSAVPKEHLELLQGHATLLQELKAQVGELMAKTAKPEKPSPPPATPAVPKEHLELLQGLQAQIAELSGKVVANQAPAATQAVTPEPEPKPVDAIVQPSSEAAASAEEPKPAKAPAEPQEAENDPTPPVEEEASAPAEATASAKKKKKKGNK